MDTFKSIADSIPFIKKAAQQTKCDPVYVLILFIVASLIIIQKTVLGGLISCLLSIYFPVREAILTIQSPTPKLNEQKKLLVVFVFFSLFTFLEVIGIGKIIPMFSITKILFLFWLNYDEMHTNAIADATLKKIPHHVLNCGDSIESAVKKAAKSVESRIEIKKS
ncbi:hypothetical protein GINT2_001400 [Glugoides intestinalis]